MSMRETQPAISDLRLERYRLGELSEGEREAMTGRLSAEPELRARLSELERSDREIAAAYGAAAMAEAIRGRIRQSGIAEEAASDRAKAGGSVAPRRAWLLPAAAVAVCLCVAAVTGSIWLLRPPADDTTVKGGGEATLVIHRRVGEGSEELGRGAVVRPGDQIRLGYRASGRAYGVILSIDGRGALTQHLPRSGDRAAALQPSGTAFLDFAYELDDAPRWEAFYLVTSDAPFDLAPVRRAVREAGGRELPAALNLSGRMTQFLFPLTKDHR